MTTRLAWILALTSACSDPCAASVTPTPPPTPPNQDCQQGTLAQTVESCTPPSNSAIGFVCVPPAGLTHSTVVNVGRVEQTPTQVQVIIECAADAFIGPLVPIEAFTPLSVDKTMTEACSVSPKGDKEFNLFSVEYTGCYPHPTE